MDIATVFRLIFVVGIVAIPILYWITARPQRRDRGGDGRAERESSRGEEVTTRVPEPQGEEARPR